MGRSRSRSRTPKRHHKSKHRKKSKSKERERDRSERRSISILSHSKYSRDRSHERSPKSRYNTSNNEIWHQHQFHYAVKYEKKSIQVPNASLFMSAMVLWVESPHILHYSSCELKSKQTNVKLFSLVVLVF